MTLAPGTPLAASLCFDKAAPGSAVWRWPMAWRSVRVRLWPVLRAMMDLGFGYAAAWSTLVGCQFHGKSSSIRLAG
ncbi:MAG: hypothetical protein Q8N19_03965 [Phenylobacterium sp.]|uniref:hypothetical protein n=1 Tax=Phenylobacterium sp. TaxID=1871053 RepID=UPI002736F944|nr:hypothetical protein [Phenylobacterium sp.]MDP3116250.1 hypothetical protein [Phenylobacterium sp.]